MLRVGSSGNVSRTRAEYSSNAERGTRLDITVKLVEIVLNSRIMAGHLSGVHATGRTTPNSILRIITGNARFSWSGMYINEFSQITCPHCGTALTTTPSPTPPTALSPVQFNNERLILCPVHVSLSLCIMETVTKAERLSLSFPLTQPMRVHRIAA